jgi:hypothetical protein
MESINEMIDMGWRVYEDHRKNVHVKGLKIVKLYRYPTLIFVKNKIKSNK